jgi:hypothetical protein
VTAQSGVGITKGDRHGRREKIDYSEDRKGQLLRNVRLLDLFLRMPAKCLSL